MKRVLQQSSAFVRAAKRLVKKNPEASPLIQAAFIALVEDAFQPTL